MSKILDKLKEAEAQRERVVAERKRLEAEADAALAERELEERREHARVEPQAGEARRIETPAAAPVKAEQHAALPPSSGGRTWIAAGAVLALCLAVGAVFFRPEPAAAPGGALQLKLDRDLESFARHLKEKQ